MQSASSVFTVGSVLSRTFAILKQNPAVFFIMTLIAVVPAAILEYVSVFFDSSTIYVFCGILDMTLSLVIQGAIAYAVFMVIKGESVASINDTLSKCMTRLGPLILTSLLMGLGIIIGLFFLIIPGILLLCIWAVAVPACVVEGLGAVDSMKRSAELTKGHRWTVFGISLIIIVVAVVISFCCTLLGTLVMGSKTAGDLLFTLISIPLTAFSSVMYAVAYYDLRTIKEGVSIDRLANVFD